MEPCGGACVAVFNDVRFCVCLSGTPACAHHWAGAAASGWQTLQGGLRDLRQQAGARPHLDHQAARPPGGDGHYTGKSSWTLRSSWTLIKLILSWNSRLSPNIVLVMWQSVILVDSAWKCIVLKCFYQTPNEIVLVFDIYWLCNQKAVHVSNIIVQVLCIC